MKIEMIATIHPSDIRDEIRIKVFGSLTSLVNTMNNGSPITTKKTRQITKSGIINHDGIARYIAIKV